MLPRSLMVYKNREPGDPRPALPASYEYKPVPKIGKSRADTPSGSSCNTQKSVGLGRCAWNEAGEGPEHGAGRTRKAYATAERVYHARTSEEEEDGGDDRCLQMEHVGAFPLPRRTRPFTKVERRSWLKLNMNTSFSNDPSPCIFFHFQFSIPPSLPPSLALLPRQKPSRCVFPPSPRRRAREDTQSVLARAPRRAASSSSAVPSATPRAPPHARVGGVVQIRASRHEPVG